MEDSNHEGTEHTKHEETTMGRHSCLQVLEGLSCRRWSRIDRVVYEIKTETIDLNYKEIDFN